jgi:hypothetical protein
MDLTQFKSLQLPPATLASFHLLDATARTLLFGYTVERATHHVYLDAAGDVHVLVYKPIANDRFALLSHSVGQTGGPAVKTNQDYVPNKRLYPESCDSEWCYLLQSTGVSLPFTNFDEKGQAARAMQHGLYQGLTHEDPRLVEFVDVDADGALRDIRLGTTAYLRLAEQAAYELKTPYFASEAMHTVYVPRDQALRMVTQLHLLAPSVHNGHADLSHSNQMVLLQNALQRCFNFAPEVNFLSAHFDGGARRLHGSMLNITVPALLEAHALRGDSNFKLVSIPASDSAGSLVFFSAEEGNRPQRILVITVTGKDAFCQLHIHDFGNVQVFRERSIGALADKCADEPLMEQTSF